MNIMIGEKNDCSMIAESERLETDSPSRTTFT